MKNFPIVTIAIPAYKTEYLADAITSALNQTYENVELIVVDDCPTCEVKSVVDSFADSRITYHRNEVNLGKSDPSLNWDQCLKLAHGEFICLLCDDDIYEPTFIEKLVELSEKYSDASIFRGGVKMIDAAQRVIGLFPIAAEEENVVEYIWHLHSGNSRQTISEWMMRVSALRKIGGYVNASKAWGSDAMTIFALGKTSSIITHSERLVCFRMSDINITGMQHSYIKDKIVGWDAQCKMATEIIQNSNVEYPSVILDEIRRDHKRWIKNHIAYATPAELFSLFKQRNYFRIKFRWFLKAVFYTLLRGLHLKK